MAGKKTKIDVKILSKKYRINVDKLINAWKKGYSNMEVARSFNIDLSTIHQIKSDIELAHRRIRLEQRKEDLGNYYTSKQRHIFLSPFI
ncbi:hypothetical protein [Desulfolucanica intricata]|uniref:hypothetical protein n=1 Tax=Desulfolucanica intricata TaxID=1285191 RepID=UPI00082D4B44|nr:hypothetical protein [Desulfolucanica intricata]